MGQVARAGSASDRRVDDGIAGIDRQPHRREMADDVQARTSLPVHRHWGTPMFSIRTRSALAALATAAALLLCGTPIAAQTAPPMEGETCAEGVLPAGSADTNLILTSRCVVEGGTYQFADVHILSGGVLTFKDADIDFWAANILIENGGSLVAGSPEAPFGTNGGTLTIHLWGEDQTGTDPNRQGRGVPCISDLKGQCGVPDAIWNGNQHMDGMAVPPDSARTIASLGATSEYPHASDDVQVAGDYFYAYMPLNFDGAADPVYGPGYFGYKVLGVSYGGSLQLFGRKGATYGTPECGPAPTSSGSSWARLDKPVEAGASRLVLDRPLSLAAGDRIVVTSTDYLPGHSEERTVAADVDCGTRIDLVEPLDHAHNGTRFPLDSVPAELGLDDRLREEGAEVRAAVGVLTRSIRIVSGGDTAGSEFPPEPPEGSREPGYFFGGQLIARQGFKRFQVQGVEFRQMGQGGRIGHYPVHFHHTRRAPADTFVRDSSFNESMSRWVTLHGAQNVNLERNVGWKSIGHGFYLEDGTETNNRLIANLGVFARAAVDNVQNPRKVPGILAAPDLHNSTGEQVPYRSDYDHPTVFWIMNGWNDFEDNLAVGAGTCGVCYWWLTSLNSGMSRDMKWTSYASMQEPGNPLSFGRAGMVPLKSFSGNMCSAAMTSFQTVTATEACLGVGPGNAPEPHPLNLKPIRNPLAANSGNLDYYPTLDNGGGHFPTRCDSFDCSQQPPKCGEGALDGCMVTVLDHYTTSFNWAAFNYAAIWLRPQWYLVTDSVITDVQQAGLTMVTGGGYSASDVVPGHWALVQKSAFIGETQPDNPYASRGSAFNPAGLQCAVDASNNRPKNYCLSVDEGVSIQTSNWGMYQRLFSVYDGPAYQDSNAYLNIRKLRIDDCKPFVDKTNLDGSCRPDPAPGSLPISQWLAGSLLGLPKAGPPDAPYCYMPNAAIGWKQPNGFYYPPAFHSKNLYFEDVDIRHFVITPLVLNGTYKTDFAEVERQFCVWNRGIFNGFSSNDRQTVLNDDDGSLTGYADTTIINKDEFFAAPVDATQCLSADSSRTSPYHHVTTVVYPACRMDGTCAAPDGINQGGWSGECTNEGCYGVPLWRQDLMPLADRDSGRMPTEKSIRMMGQNTGQRASLTVDHGTYYLDTTVSEATQLGAGCQEPGSSICRVNVFKPNQSYYLFLIFAKPDTEQTYRFYVGDAGDFDPSSIQMVRARLSTNPVQFDENLGPLPPGRARWLNTNQADSNGVVEVTVSLADLPGGVAAFEQGRMDKCQPKSFCHIGRANQCVANDSRYDDVCAWAGLDQDCPAGGCFGIKFTLPAGFSTREPGDPRPDPRPQARCVMPQPELPWNITYEPAQQGFRDSECPKEADLEPRDFCGLAAIRKPSEPLPPETPIPWTPIKR